MCMIKPTSLLYKLLVSTIKSGKQDLHIFNWNKLSFVFFCMFNIHSSLAFIFPICLQRLRLVEIFDVKRLQMRYATSMIG